MNDKIALGLKDHTHFYQASTLELYGLVQDESLPRKSAQGDKGSWGVFQSIDLLGIPVGTRAP
jgi:hypothetical protein